MKAPERVQSTGAMGSRKPDLAIRIAVLTAAAHLCLGLLFVAGYQVYCILETFVRPLMWALLTGTFMYPFKSFLTEFVKGWLRGLRTNSTPVIVSVAFVPARLVDRVLDYVGAEIVDFFRRYGRNLLYVVLGIIAYFVLYFYLASHVVMLGSWLGSVIEITSTVTTNTVWIFLLPYGLTLHFFWSTGYRKYLLLLTVPLWVLVGFYVYYLLGDLALPIYVFLTLTIALGYTDNDTESQQTTKNVKTSASFTAAPVKKKPSHSVLSDFQQKILTPTLPLSPKATRRESYQPGDLEIDFSDEDSDSSFSIDPPVAPGSDDQTLNGSDEKDRACQSPTNKFANLTSKLGDHAHSMGSKIMNMDWYRNVAGALNDESLSKRTAQEEADAEAIMDQLKKLGVASETSAGTRYIAYVFWMFFLLETLTNFYYMIPLILLPVSYRIIKIMFRKEGSIKRLWKPAAPYAYAAKMWIEDRAEVITPGFLRDLIKYAKAGDRKIIGIVESMTDETVAGILICLLFVGAVTGGIISMMHIEEEASYVIASSGKLIDETLKNHPELFEWLPEAASYQEHIQTALDSGYLYARDWTIKTIRATISDKNESVIAEIERDFIIIADRFYQQYVSLNSSIRSTSLATSSEQTTGITSIIGQNLQGQMSWFGTGLMEAMNGASDSNATGFSIWEFDIWSIANVDFMTEIQQYLDVSVIQSFAQNHIETFMSVLESVWQILKGNLTLIMSLMGTIASVTLAYFSVFLNFILCAVIYLTTLFYLLSSSGKRYRPIELIANAGRYYSGAETFADIVENSISGIFAVSLKIGTFYGFYTWVLLSFCGGYVKFIPSVLAAVFAVCPLVPSYVVCLPAALGAWFRGDYFTTVVLAGGAYLPKLFVDAAIYGDLETANPFIFGLSVAGGLVTLGIEGAVIGPMMLCFFIIVMECYKSLIQSRFLDEAEVENQEPNGKVH